MSASGDHGSIVFIVLLLIITTSPLEPRRSSTPKRYAYSFLTFTIHIPSTLPSTKSSHSVCQLRFDLAINELILAFPIDIFRLSKTAYDSRIPSTSTLYLVIDRRQHKRQTNIFFPFLFLSRCFGALRRPMAAGLSLTSVKAIIEWEKAFRVSEGRASWIAEHAGAVQTAGP